MTETMVASISALIILWVCAWVALALALIDGVRIPDKKMLLYKRVFAGLFVLVLASVAVGCAKRTTYKELIATAKYKKGDVIVIDEGFFDGCHLTVDSVELRDDRIIYGGTSPDCPVKGASGKRVYRND